jgi:hypothetical protein
MLEDWLRELQLLVLRSILGSRLGGSRLLFSLLLMTNITVVTFMENEHFKGVHCT